MCEYCKDGKAKEEFKEWGNYCSKTCTNKGEKQKEGK